jgi:hypothetical protein
MYPVLAGVPCGGESVDLIQVSTPPDRCLVRQLFLLLHILPPPYDAQMDLKLLSNLSIRDRGPNGLPNQHNLNNSSNSRLIATSRNSRTMPNLSHTQSSATPGCSRCLTSSASGCASVLRPKILTQDLLSGTVCSASTHSRALFSPLGLAS